MFRSTLFLALAVSLAGTAVAQTPKAEPLLFGSDQGAVGVTVAVAGADLSITWEFEKPVKSYPNADAPYVSMELDLDTDNNAKTGWSQVDDLRRGSEFMTEFIVRLPGAGKAEEFFVTRYPTDPKAPGGTTVKGDARLRVDGTRANLLIPLSALGLRKGQTIRVIPVPPGQDVTRDQTLTLR